MQNPTLTVALLLSFTIASAQLVKNDFEKYPVFPECSEITAQELPNCFSNTLINFVLNNYNVPQAIVDDDYNGDVMVLFEVNRSGEFHVINVESTYTSLKDEARRVFEALPVIEPATYDGRPSFLQFTLPIEIPLSRNSIQETSQPQTGVSGRVTPNKPRELPATNSRDTLVNELEALASKKFDRQSKYTSQLNIPFSYEVYSRFDADLNKVGHNSHTASRPFLYLSLIHI